MLLHRHGRLALSPATLTVATYGADFFNGGELYHYISRGRFTEERSRFYAAEIILGMEHMHSLGIVYRDLKVRMRARAHLGVTHGRLCRSPKTCCWMRTATFVSRISGAFAARCPFHPPHLMRTLARSLSKENVVDDSLSSICGTPECARARMLPAPGGLRAPTDPSFWRRAAGTLLRRSSSGRSTARPWTGGLWARCSLR